MLFIPTSCFYHLYLHTFVILHLNFLSDLILFTQSVIWLLVNLEPALLFQLNVLQSQRARAGPKLINFQTRQNTFSFTFRSLFIEGKCPTDRFCALIRSTCNFYLLRIFYVNTTPEKGIYILWRRNLKNNLCITERVVKRGI